MRCVNSILGRQRGQALVIAVLAMGILLGMVAMAVDVGLYLKERRGLQNAADAAALAGALELPGDPEAAVEKATEWVANNGIDVDGDDGSLELEGIEVTTTYQPNDTISVSVRRNVSFFFARVLGVTDGDVTAMATAQIGSVGGMGGLAPWAVEESVFLGLDPGDTATLKYNAGNVQNGNFLPLALDGTGGSEYRENIKYGSDSWLCVVGQEEPDCPSQASTQTGNMLGPTGQAVQWLIDNTSPECDTFEEVFTPDPDGPSAYQMNAICNPFDDEGPPSHRVVVVPVIDSLCNGHCDVNVLRFALFFIESFQCGGQGMGNSCEVVGRYVETSFDMGAFIGPFDPLGSVNFVRLVE